MIRIQSLAHRDDIQQDETMDLLVSGKLTLVPEGVRLVYDELMDEKLEHVEMNIRQDMIMVNRNGDFSSQMSFRMGMRSEGIYQTPFGAIDLATYCTRLSYDINEDGGTIQIVYQLDMNGHFAAVHEIELNMVPENA